MRHTIGLGLALLATPGVFGCSIEPGDEIAGEQQQAIVNGTTLAVFNDTAQRWYYDANGDGVWTTGVDIESGLGAFGGVGDVALSGYGDLSDCGDYGGRIGVYRPSTRQFLLDANNDKVWNGTPTDRAISNFLPALAGHTDQPFIFAVRRTTGEFPQCRGVVGYFRTPNVGGAGVWFIDLNNNGVWDGSTVDGQYTWGVTGDIAVPLGAVWAPSRLTVFKPSTGTWIKDDGDKVWEGCGTDSCLVFGNPNTKPISNPNGVMRGISEGTSRFFDTNNSGVWDAGDANYTFGAAVTQAIIY